MVKVLADIHPIQKCVFENLNCCGVRRAKMLAQIALDGVHESGGGGDWFDIIDRQAALGETLVELLGEVESTLERLNEEAHKGSVSATVLNL